MRPAKVITTLILISMLANPVSVLAQEPLTSAPDPWAAVKSLPMGSELVVKLRDNNKVKGSLITATETELRVSLGKSITSIARDNIVAR